MWSCLEVFSRTPSVPVRPLRCKLVMGSLFVLVLFLVVCERAFDQQYGLCDHCVSSQLSVSMNATPKVYICSGTNALVNGFSVVCLGQMATRKGPK